MKGSIYLLCLAAICILPACAIDSNNDSGVNMATSVTIETSESSISNESIANETAQPDNESFLNLDQLEQYRIITGTSREYTETDMANLAKDDMQKDYVAVIKNYMRQELGHEVSYLDSVDGTYNPRKVVVGTNEGNTYMLELRKWYNYNGIWTVTNLAQFKEDGAMPPEQSVTYEIIDVSSIGDPGIVKEANEKISARNAGHYHFIADDKLYILLVAGMEHSVELLNVFGNESLMRIQYATIENKDPRFGENPYLILKLDATVMDLFIQQFADTKVDDIRLNLP
jgi:hypothetical protein